MKRLIVNADDFGMAPEFNHAIAQLLEEGHISSASLMPVGPAYEDALKHITERNLSNIGWHITLTRENFGIEEQLKYKSLSGKSSLTDDNGFLHPGKDMFRQVANDSDIIKELSLQIHKLETDGINITHIDSHMYSLFPLLGRRGYRLLFDVLKRNNLKSRTGIRITKHYYLFSGINYIWGGRKVNMWLKWKLLFSELCGVDYSFAFPYYATDYGSLKQKKELFYRFLSTLRDGITEIHFHPAVYSRQLKKQNPFWKNRVHEYEMLQEVSAESLLREYGIELSYYASVSR